MSELERQRKLKNEFSKDEVAVQIAKNFRNVICTISILIILAVYTITILL